jgi:diguanylate cyclase (GGDEF)-like protein
MDGHFVEVVNRCRETNCELHFALLDVDNFKQLNDCCGHDYGDLVLQRLVSVFGAQFPNQGYTIRMGGDEFALLFSAREPETIITDGIEALQRDEKLFCEGKMGKVQLSTGLVSIDVGREVRLDVLYAAADKALYRAKSKQGTVIGQSHLVA